MASRPSSGAKWVSWMGKTPYAAAFGKLGKIRSAGVTEQFGDGRI